jgi:hypothetical protein
MRYSFYLDESDRAREHPAGLYLCPCGENQCNLFRFILFDLVNRAHIRATWGLRICEKADVR